MFEELNFDLTQGTSLSPSCGTTARTAFDLSEQSMVLTTECTDLLPDIHRLLSKRAERQQVAQSLERSLKDNADVWTALSQY